MISRWAPTLTVAALAFALLAVACGGDEPAPSGSPGAAVPATPGAFPTGTAVIHTDQGTVEVAVEIADTPSARERGLMGRTELGEDSGMVFLFDEPAPVAFWMKETLIPLSIAFWDEDGRIVAIEEMVPCEADPCPLTRAPSPVAGALEANAGYFEERGVDVGDRIEIRRTEA